MTSASRLSTAPPLRHRRGPLVPTSLVVLLFLTALLGRYSLDRAGIDNHLDLRVTAAAVLVLATLIWRAGIGGPRYRHTWGPPGQWGMLLLGYLVCSGLWAPPPARVGQLVVDLLVLAVLFAVALTISAPNPDRSARILLHLLLGAGCAYAVLGLTLSQTTVQGRLSLFGGGPNVFVRVVLLGVLAALALSVIRRSYLYLLPVPPMAVAALLSGSRGGLLAGVITLLVFGLIYRARIGASRLLAVAGVGGAATMAGVAVLAQDSVGLLQDRFLVGTAEAATLSYRPQLLSEAWTIFAGQPLLGGGVDSFYAASGYYGGWDYAHNFPASVAAEGGLVGLVLLGGLLWAIGRAVSPVRAVSTERSACLFAAIYIAAASLFSGDYYDTRFAWVFIAVAVNNVARPDGRRPAAAAKTGPAR